MRISIVIPTLNEAAVIAAALDHAAALDPWELVVADADSNDGTPALAAAAGAIVVRSDRGRGSQQNAGAAVATGEVLLFLHADTWLEPQAAEQIRAALVNPAVLAGAFRQQIDASGWQYRLLEAGNAFRARWWGLPYGDQGIFFRREVLAQLGGFPDVPIMEDLILMRRLRRLARPVLLAGPIHVSARRWREQGVVRQTMRNWLLLAAERCGVAPERLAAWYRPHNPDTDTKQHTHSG